MEKTILNIKYVGVDNWSRPVFKLVNAYKGIDNKPIAVMKMYFGSVDALLPDVRIAPNETVEEINNFFRKNIHFLEYFGRSFGCEPHGGLNPNYQLNIID